MAENKMKIRDIAERMNTTSKRIVAKLEEIGITGKSAAGSLNEEEMRRFFEATGNQRGLDMLDGKGETEETKDAAEVKEDNASKTAPAARQQRTQPAQGKSSTFVIGRVLKRDEPSGTYSNYGTADNRVKTTQERKSSSSSSTASSDLRSGYVTRKGSNDYSRYMVKDGQQVKKDQTQSVSSDGQKTDSKSDETEQKQTTVVRKVVKKVVTSAKPAEEIKPEEIPAEPVTETEEKKKEAAVNETSEVRQEKEPAKETKEQEVKTAEPEKTVPEQSATEKKEEPENILPEKDEKKPDVKEPVRTQERTEEKRQESYRPQREQFSGDRRDGGYRQRQDAQQGERKPFDRQNQSGGRQGYQQGDRKPFDRQGQPQRQGQGKDFQGKDKDYNNQGRQGDRRPQGQNGQNYRPAGQKIPSVPSEVAIEEERKRRPQDNTFNKLNKKEKQESAAARNQNAGSASREKYSSARQFVGEKKGVSEVYTDDFSIDIDGGSYSGKSKRDKKNKNAKQEFAPKQPVAVLTNVKLPETLTVREFAEAIKKSAADVIKKMFMMGSMANQNESIGFDTMEIIASEFGITAEKEVVISVEEQIFDDSDDANDEGAVARPPVVVVMGHVDHGKTSLLDAIRAANVTAGEAGGITQHIGAYTVKINGRNITFLDTPGHEAFTAMRARGAEVTDVAILVVAADDGVKPQTIESINHAKAAKVSIVVAVNKIDKEGANIEKVRQELAEHDVVCEEWGGDVPFIPVSAKKHQNIETLLETVLLSADILDLKANPDKQAKGTIIEAKLDKNKGPVATLLVQRGTLKQGDFIISGTVVGKVRTMTDDKGSAIKKAGPSTPVEITGLPEVPEAGETFYVVEDEKKAKQVVEHRKTTEREKMIKASTKVSLDDLFNQIHEGEMKELNIIVKADVQGSVEAVKQSLEKLSNDEVKIRIIHGAVGAVNESDVTLASVSNAIIIGFNVRPITGIAEQAEAMGVDMRLYRVIYDAIDDIQAAMNGMLEPEFKEVAQGSAEIRQIYKVSGVGSIAGCYVTSGKIVRNSNVRIVRNGIVVFEGKLASLKRFKDDAKEVAQGFECGMSFERFNDIKESDVVECYVMEEIKRG